MERLYAIDWSHSNLKFKFTYEVLDTRAGEEIPPEERDNLYYANKYADRFMQILSMIEHGELTFDSIEENNREWHAVNHARCKYKERAERYEAVKKLGRDLTPEEYLYKHGYDKSA